MHTYKMGNAQVPVFYAPIGEGPANTPIWAAHRMGQPGAHQEAFEGKNHEQDNTQPDPPYIISRQLRKALGEEQNADVGGVYTGGGGAQGHQAIQDAVQGGADIKMRLL